MARTNERLVTIEGSDVDTKYNGGIEVQLDGRGFASVRSNLSRRRRKVDMSQRFWPVLATALVVLAPRCGLAQAPFAFSWGTEGKGELGNGPPPNGLSFPGP